MGAIDTVEPGAVERDFSRVDRVVLIAELRSILPPAALLVDHEDLKPYECDGLAAYREMPLLVALPDDETQVVAILKACRRLGVPVVARGAGTGLSGGAMPHKFGLLLSLAKFKRIIKVDPVARLAVVQPGVRNLAGLLLGFRIPKGTKTSNWAARQLSPQQILYAATDAWACRELYLRFCELRLV